MTKLNEVVELKTKRFVIRKSLVGKNQVLSFTNSKGVNVKYNHDVAYKLLKSTLDNLPCFAKYKSYTATNNIPVVLRDKKLV